MLLPNHPHVQERIQLRCLEGSHAWILGHAQDWNLTCREMGLCETHSDSQYSLPKAHAWPVTRQTPMMMQTVHPT